jgi:predicted NBD/HSP70 family sugar kinase
MGDSTVLKLAVAVGPGAILALIRSGEAVTRSQIMALTGLSRSTVAKRLDGLIACGYIAPASSESAGGGRPPAAFRINRDVGVMLLASVGARAMQLAVGDMTREILARQSHQFSLADGPAAVLAEMSSRFDQLLAQGNRSRADVKGLGIALPGAVEFAPGKPLRPPIMSGWDGDRVPDFFAAHYACPVVVDQEVNLMALAEHRGAWPDVTHLLFIRIGAGIGAGLIIEGALQRGAQGAAGDIGHLFAGHGGCLEAYASGWAICRELSARGHQADTLGDIADLAANGERDAVELLQTSGRLIGESVAVAVSLLNPSLVVVGGELALGQSHLLAALRETVYRRSLPQATRHLQIVTSRQGQDAALIGAAHLVSDAVHAPARVDAVLERLS